MELLRTYSDENASEVKGDAKNCIVSLLGRPNVLIMDFLLTLPPVAALQDEPIYQVLQQCLEGQCHPFLVSLRIAPKRICFSGIVKIMVEFCLQ